MKALTICQPYAHLIALPDDDDLAKRIENRTWHCGYLGTLLIHAGKSRNWLALSNDKSRDIAYGLNVSDMAFGAIVAVCDMRACIPIAYPAGGKGPMEIPDWAERRWPWIPTHQHAEGPFGFVLAEVHRLPQPIPCSGAQGLWVPKPDIVAEVHRQIPALTRD